MRILAIVNQDEGPPALVGERIVARGGICEQVNPHQGGALPETAADFDGVLVFGGAQTADDEAGFPAFGAVLELLRDFHQAEKPVMGICLGAQLLARAFHKPVLARHSMEWGFVPLEVTAAGAADPLLAEMERHPVIFQWHTDTFELPEGARLLLTGKGCRNQGFRLGAATYGFQCHFEATRELIESWLAKGTDSARRILGPDADGAIAGLDAEMARHLGAAGRFAQVVSDRWLDLVELRMARDGAGSPSGPGGRNG